LVFIVRREGSTQNTILVGLVNEVMSNVTEAAADKEVCANCGIAGVDDIKLDECHGCDLVKYCSDKCRGEHREQHHEDCKRRAKELHDKRLFTQPDGIYLGECPICFLSNPIDAAKTTFMSCCGQSICRGCGYAHMMSSIHDVVNASRCLFCRTSVLDKEEYEKRTQERIEANDPGALREMGSEGYREGDYDKALNYWTKAAELGDAEAQCLLGRMMYGEGVGVEKDNEKEVYHYEKAAIGGHPLARHNLACYEEDNGKIERAVKHYIIAANLGYDKSMKQLLPMYKDGYISEEEYGSTLRTHQAAIDATKSAQREKALSKIGKWGLYRALLMSSQREEAGNTFWGGNTSETNDNTNSCVFFISNLLA
jgi:hypothetical protein